MTVYRAARRASRPVPLPLVPDGALWLSPADVAARVPGLTVANLQELRKKGLGPAYFKPTGVHGKVLLYAAADVEAWIRRSRISTREQS